MYEAAAFKVAPELLNHAGEALAALRGIKSKIILVKYFFNFLSMYFKPLLSRPTHLQYLKNSSTLPLRALSLAKAMMLL